METKLNALGRFGKGKYTKNISVKLRMSKGLGEVLKFYNSSLRLLHKSL